MYALSVGTIAAAIGMAASFRILQARFFAKAIMPAQSSYVELRSKYGKWTTYLTLLMLLVAAPASFVFWCLLKILARWYAGQLPSADVTFAPAVAVYWVLPAGLLGLVCGGIAAMWTARRLLGERYSEFLAYRSLSNGMDPIDANIAILQVCTIACIGLIFAGLLAFGSTATP
jgi:hypothetical protein